MDLAENFRVQNNICVECGWLQFKLEASTQIIVNNKDDLAQDVANRHESFHSRWNW